MDLESKLWSQFRNCYCRSCLSTCNCAFKHFVVYVYCNLWGSLSTWLSIHGPAWNVDVVNIVYTVHQLVVHTGCWHSGCCQTICHYIVLSSALPYIHTTICWIMCKLSPDNVYCHAAHVSLTHGKDFPFLFILTGTDPWKNPVWSVMWKCLPYSREIWQLLKLPKKTFGQNFTHRLQYKICKFCTANYKCARPGNEANLPVYDVAISCNTHCLALPESARYDRRVQSRKLHSSSSYLIEVPHSKYN